MYYVKTVCSVYCAQHYVTCLIQQLASGLEFGSLFNHFVKKAYISRPDPVFHILCTYSEHNVMCMFWFVVNDCDCGILGNPRDVSVVS